ncbi:MAG: nucleotidyltransferase family protein [Burkholderiaceae bacterium]
MTVRPAVIVLAAGKGTRFKQEEHKPAQRKPGDHKLAQGLGPYSVLGTTLRRAIASQLPVVVVASEPLAELARRSIASRDVIIVPEVGTPGFEALGMGYSIAMGVMARADAGGWLILPGDMPLVRPATLIAVARELTQHPVVYAQYKGRRGHPVGFAAELYSELAMLTGDDGARRIVSRYPALGLELDDPGVLVDIDTESDLDRLREALDTAPIPLSDS